MINRKFTFFIALVMFSCHERKNQTKDVTIDSYQVLALLTKKVTIYNDFPATIQGEDIVEIKPMVSGYLQNIYVPEGTNVSKGQLLFRIKNPQYEQDIIAAQAAIKIAEANVNTARMNVEKVKPLVVQEIVSKYQLDAATYTLQSEQASLAQAKASLANAQTNQDYTYIRSPQSGTIGLIPYKIGALISSTAADALTTVSNTTNVFAYFSINEKQLLDFMTKVKGQTMNQRLSQIPAVTLVLSNGSIYPEKGILETASGSIDNNTGTATFKAIFKNPLGLVQNGSSATIRIPKDLDQAIIVPQIAVYQLQDKSFVYQVNDKNKVLSKQVTTSPTNDGAFVVINSGLIVGDRIVLNGINLNDSTQINPLKVNVDSIYSKMKTN